MSRRKLISGLAAALGGCGITAPSDDRVIVVFFETDSAALAGPALELIRSAAVAAARTPNAPVRVLGFADTENSTRFSQALSRARAEHVAELLRQAGIPLERIRVSARGPVAIESMEQEARRVEIHVG